MGGINLHFFVKSSDFQKCVSPSSVVGFPWFFKLTAKTSSSRENYFYELKTNRKKIGKTKIIDNFAFTRFQQILRSESNSTANFTLDFFSASHPTHQIALLLARERDFCTRWRWCLYHTLLKNLPLSPQWGLPSGYDNFSDTKIVFYSEFRPIIFFLGHFTH